MRSPQLRSKLVEIPCSRSWGAMQRNSLPNLLIVLSQRDPSDAILPLPSPFPPSSEVDHKHQNIVASNVDRT